MKQSSAFHWQDRVKAGSIHLGISLMIAVLAAVLVFGIWYPYPYGETSGGRQLFLLVVTVDVIVGPLITFAVFNRRKPRDELVRDLAIVGLIQIAALSYGLWTVAVARPVHLVFEFDRFRVVHAIDVPEEKLSQAPSDIRTLPWTGPTMLAVRPFRDANEQSTATLMALHGQPLSARPELWQNYAEARARVLAAAKPAAALRARFAARVAEIDAAVAKTGKAADKLVYLPLVSRTSSFWTVLLDADSAQVLGFIPLDSF